MSFRDKLLDFGVFFGLVDTGDDASGVQEDGELSYVGDDETSEWFTLDSISKNDSNQERLFCLTVDSPGHQFLIGEDFSVPTHNSDEAKAEQELRDECRQLIGSILRLGRAAGVHFVGATQRPDAKMLPGEMKANMPTRVCAGSVDGTASSMILDDAEGTRVKSAPRGRLYAKNHQTGFHAQGFFVGAEWIDEYRRSIGLNPDGTPIEGVSLGGNDSSIEEPYEEPGSSDEQDYVTFDTVGDDAFEEVDDDSDLDGDFAFIPVSIDDTGNEQYDDTDSEQYDEPNPEPRELTEGEKAGLILQGSANVQDKYHHPEDDWDDDLDSLINENKNFFRSGQ